MLTLIKINKIFFTLSFSSLLLFVISKLSSFNLRFEVSISEFMFESTYNAIWLFIAIYYAIIALLYFLISKSKLISKNWLLNLHITLSVLFFISIVGFYIIDFNLITSTFKNFTTKELDKIIMYANWLAITIVLFICNILCLLIILWQYAK